MTYAEMIQIITGFIGTVGFSFLFNIKGRRLIATAVGGFLSWLFFVLLGNIIASEPTRYFIVAASISVYAEVMARLLRTPTTTMLMTSLVPLIPGGSLYYTMAYALESDITRFLEKGISTLKLAVALALGIVVATTMARIVNKIVIKRQRKGD